MKSARPPAAESSTAASRRAQPVRQTRTNPPRTSSLQRGNSFAGGPPPEQPIDIFPAITHFTDAITALPKELVRHFTLLKEVDAKIFAPEAALSELLEVALKTPVPDPVRSVNDVSTPGSVGMSTHNSTAGPVAGVNPVAAPASEGSTVASAFDPSNVPRRQLFRQTAFKIQEMLTSLEEKNHVISTANDALQKQIGRIEEIWPHLETHFSDEAKWGSTTHWAYTENRQQKTNNAQAERSRREGAATLSAAAQALAEEAAARSNDRKQALAAKKNSRAAQNADADADGKQQETGKKAQGAKSKKTAPTVADAANLIGLGISHTAPPVTNPPPKRRKVANDRKPEPLTNTGKPERAMAGVFGAEAPKPKTTSPRQTPAPDGTTAAAAGPSKKRKALPTSSGQAKKSRTTAVAMSPSVASSPLVGTFPEHTKVGRVSPAPLPNGPPRPTSSRARQNSAQTTKADTAKERPGSAASNKPNGSHAGTPDIPVQTNGAKATVEAKPPKGAAPAAAPSKPEPPAKPEVETAIPPPPEPPAPNGSITSKKEVSIKVAEEREPRRDSATPILPPTPALKTKSGRASKPSTPALATFAEAQAASAASRSRPSRNAEGGPVGTNNGAAATATATAAAATAAKRSHKKGASISAAAAGAAGLISIQAAGHPPATGGPGGSGEETVAVGRGSKNGGNGKAGRGDKNGDDDDDEPDVNEPRYCICNQVSYGEMVGCDADGCPREWFHLECVGLEVAPKGKAKWYCEDCKKRLRIGERVGRS
ncbi:hypothetical protein QBC39DRAFT_20334 [Podospora conica]|nr:hypothetical protein QBC39DRAFT_20334 [Schizothecium conicum]